MQHIAYHIHTPKTKLLLWQKRIPAAHLAQRWGCHPATVSRVINGKIKDPAWIRKLAKALNVPVSEICRVEIQSPKEAPNATAKCPHAKTARLRPPLPPPAARPAAAEPLH